MKSCKKVINLISKYKNLDRTASLKDLIQIILEDSMNFSKNMQIYKIICIDLYLINIGQV